MRGGSSRGRRWPLALRLGLAGVAAVFALLVLRLLVADDGFPALLTLRADLEALRQDASALAERNQELGAAIRGLRHDLHPVERIAREELDFAAPGEITYLFPADLEARQRPRKLDGTERAR